MSFHGGFLGCVVAVLLFGWRNKVPVLSLGDVTCAVGTIGLLLGRLANFINSELWGRVTDVPWAFVFPTGGPLPRHPSQLYEAALEGVLLFVVLTLMIRRGALHAAGADRRHLCDRLRSRADFQRILPRAGPAARIPVGSSHHGHAVVAADDRRRAWLSCYGLCVGREPARSSTNKRQP